MGYEESKARIALQKNDCDFNEAFNVLLNDL